MLYMPTTRLTLSSYMFYKQEIIEDISMKIMLWQLLFDNYALTIKIHFSSKLLEYTLRLFVYLIHLFIEQFLFSFNIESFK